MNDPWRMGCGNIPPTTIQRLPLYLRCLIEAQAQRVPVINSVGIAEMAGTNAAQVRKDLSYLGELGTRGIGYDVDGLITHLARRLGLTKTRRIAIAGFGRLGSALVTYPGFQDRGFEVVAVFETDPEKIGKPAMDGLAVSSIADIDRVVSENDVEILIIATPSNQAQSVAQSAARAGVRAVLNFAPVQLNLPGGTAVRQADLSTELQILSFYLTCEEART
ncbi:MAG: redox-sensing transcriptional repressor Rex [Coriobacteriia bacterium]|nr:redox-sensing transcriptional repressor Rex [Coriobacteriia bacterium]